jgi:hypothetical protein
VLTSERFPPTILNGCHYIKALSPYRKSALRTFTVCIMKQLYSGAAGSCSTVCCLIWGGGGTVCQYNVYLCPEGARFCLSIATEGVRGILQFLLAHCRVLGSACSARCCKRRLNEPELDAINSIWSFNFSVDGAVSDNDVMLGHLIQHFAVQIIAVCWRKRILLTAISVVSASSRWRGFSGTYCTAWVSKGKCDWRRNVWSNKLCLIWRYSSGGGVNLQVQTAQRRRQELLNVRSI